MASDGLAFTTINSNLERDNRSMLVWLWDLGPVKPQPPVRPTLPVRTKPEGKPDPEFDLAMIEYNDALEDYAAGLRSYKAAKQEHADWHKRNGGPVEIDFYSCDATDALQRDPERYCVSSRTRGHESLKNRGLPAGWEPGHGQAVKEQRERQGMIDLNALRQADPVFGKQEARA